MFETSYVRPHTTAATRRRGLFATSVGVHAFFATAVIAASITAVHFPTRAPNQMATFQPMMKVSLPAASQPARPQPRPAAAQPPAARIPRQETAPAAIPDQVTPAQPLASSANPDLPAGPSSDQSGPTDAIPIGGPSGPAVTPVPDGPIEWTPGGKVTAPVAIHRVAPLYPEIARRAHMSGVVVLRCIIDKSGHITAADVVSSSFAAFNDPALDAVRQWTFAPGTLNGHAVDVIFELTVKFTLG